MIDWSDVLESGTVSVFVSSLVAWWVSANLNDRERRVVARDSVHDLLDEVVSDVRLYWSRSGCDQKAEEQIVKTIDRLGGRIIRYDENYQGSSKNSDIRRVVLELKNLCTGGDFATKNRGVNRSIALRAKGLADDLCRLIK